MGELASPDLESCTRFRTDFPPRDGYDSREAQLRESLQSYKGLYNANRGQQRYDPHTRKYVTWEFDSNYNQDPRATYPLLTHKEYDWLSRHPRRRPQSKSWSATGPKASHESPVPRKIRH